MTSPITITIRADLVNYPFVFESFNFSIEVIDLCASTTMTFAPVTDMLAYVNLATETQTILATDSAS